MTFKNGDKANHISYPGDVCTIVGPHPLMPGHTVYVRRGELKRGFTDRLTLIESAAPSWTADNGPADVVLVGKRHTYGPMWAQRRDNCGSCGHPHDDNFDYCRWPKDVTVTLDPADPDPFVGYEACWCPQFVKGA